MKKLKTTNITTSVAMPLKSGTLDHVQSAYEEITSSTIQGMLNGTYDTAKGYILNGCVNSGTGATYTISAGSVFVNGEVYQVDAASFSISGANVAVGIVTTTNFSAVNADPVAFTDGVSRNVHEIRKIVFQAGLSGSGAFDYIDAIRLQIVQVSDVLIKTNTTSFTPTSNYNPSTKKYVDDQIATVTPMLKIKAYGTQYVGDVSTNQSITVSIGVTLTSVNYIALVTITSTVATASLDNNLSWVVYDKQNSSFKVSVDDTSGSSGTQNISIDWIIFQA